MLEWIPRGLRQGRITTRYPRAAGDARPPASAGTSRCSTPPTRRAELAELCPTGAISVDAHGGSTLDRGRCILCGECVRAAPDRFALRRAI